MFDEFCLKWAVCEHLIYTDYSVAVVLHTHTTHAVTWRWFVWMEYVGRGGHIIPVHQLCVYDGSSVCVCLWMISDMIMKLRWVRLELERCIWQAHCMRIHSDSVERNIHEKSLTKRRKIWENLVAVQSVLDTFFWRRNGAEEGEECSHKQITGEDRRS